MKKGLIALLQVIIVVAVATVVIMIASNQKKPLSVTPPGWIHLRPPHEVSAMVIDGNTVWAGGRDGVYRLNAQTRQVKEKLMPNKPLEYVRALAIDVDGKLWIGHPEGLTVYDGKSYKTLTEQDGLPDKRINSLLYIRDNGSFHNVLIIGTWGGVALWDGIVLKTIFTKDNGLMDNMVNVIMADKSGGLWFGSYTAPSGGISYVYNNKWQYFSTDNGIPHNCINALTEDKEGKVWAGTGFVDHGGAAVFEKKDEKWEISKIIRKEDGLAGIKVRSIFQDAQGSMWIGSEYDGIVWFHGKKRSLFTKENALTENEVKVMLQEDKGAIWMGTTDGISIMEDDE